MSVIPSKRRRFQSIQGIESEAITRICRIGLKLNLKQYNHILLDWINGRCDDNIDHIQTIFSNYLCEGTSFCDSMCGYDYLKMNLDLFHDINIDYNHEQDVIKIYHKRQNHILGIYSKNEDTNEKQLKIQSSVYVILRLLQHINDIKHTYICN